MKLGTGSGLVQRPSVNRGEKGGKERVRDSGGDEDSSQRFWQLSRVFVVGCWSRFAEAIVLGDRSYGDGQEGLGKEQLE
jgi:hypothetical protein